MAEPDLEARLLHGLADNAGLVIGFVALLVTLAYFYRRWRAVGRDPEPGVVFPRFEAPEGLSPAATGYVWARANGTVMRRTLAFIVVLTSLAIRGRLVIEEDGKTFILSRDGQQDGNRKSRWARRAGDKLPSGEAAAMAALFPQDSGRVEIKRKYDAAISSAVGQVFDALEGEHDKVYFRHNIAFWVIGLLIALAGIAAALTVQYGDPEFLVMVAFGAVFVGGFSVPVVFFARHIGPLWLKLLRGDTGQLMSTLFMTLIIAPFSMPLFGSIYLINDQFGPLMLLFVCAQVVTVGLFWSLLKAPTRLGQDMRDGIEGYLLYLTVAEADRLNMLTAEPEMTVEQFEYHLPYAMALGVEEAWTRRFTASADAAVRQAVERSRSWYISRDGSPGIAAVAGGLSGGLSRTLSSAATRPSSSSSGGSSGGGSSGGGGGGGGGGSW
ncbi:MAG: hypothetical protein ACFB13_03000 [Kiloniellaceae bacterium]